MKVRRFIPLVAIAFLLVSGYAIAGDSAASGQSSVSLKGEFDGLFDQIGKNFEKFESDIRIKIINTPVVGGTSANSSATVSAAGQTQTSKSASGGVQALDNLDKAFDGMVTFEKPPTPLTILSGEKSTGEAKNKIKAFLAKLETKIKELKAKLSSGGSQAQSSADAALNRELLNVSGSIQKVFQGKSKNFKSLEESLKQIGGEFRNFGDGLKGEIDTAGSTIGNTVQNLGTELNRAFSGIEAAISGYTMVPGAQPPFTSSTSPNPGAGKNNYCGQYAMSTVFNSLGVNKSFDQVFKDTNPASIFTSPGTIESYLRKSGVAARMTQRNTSSDIKKQIDSGKPVMILVDCGGTPHWVAVVGYKTGSDGKTTFRIADSVWGIRQSSGIAEMSEEELTRIWAKPLGNGALGWLTNYESLMITVGDAGSANGDPLISMPTSTSVEDSLGRGVCNVVAGWKNRNFGQVLSGVGDSLAGLAGAIPNLAGKAIKKGSSALKEWGAKQKEKGGFFGNVLGTGASLLGSVGSVGGKVLETTGNVLISAGQTIVNGAKKVGGWIKGLFS